MCLFNMWCVFIVRRKVSIFQLNTWCVSMFRSKALDFGAQHMLYTWCFKEERSVDSGACRSAVPAGATQRRQQKESCTWWFKPATTLQVRDRCGHLSPCPTWRSSRPPAGRDFTTAESVQRGRGGEQFCVPAKRSAVGPLLYGADPQFPGLSASAVSQCWCPCQNYVSVSVSIIINVRVSISASIYL